MNKLFLISGISVFSMSTQALEAWPWSKNQLDTVATVADKLEPKNMLNFFQRTFDEISTLNETEQLRLGRLAAGGIVGFITYNISNTVLECFPFVSNYLVRGSASTILAAFVLSSLQQDIYWNFFKDKSSIVLKSFQDLFQEALNQK